MVAVRWRSARGAIGRCAGALFVPSRTRGTLDQGGELQSLLAYLEPGSGSMVLQIIAGGLAAVTVAAKFYWRRLLRLLRIRRDEPKPVPSVAENEVPQTEGARGRTPTT
jgi:hypothetical protein